MATDVVMPQMGESIAEGTITKWLAKVGDTVERDQPLFEISTDKVDAEIPSPVSGVLLAIHHEEGATVAVDSVVAQIGEAGEEPGSAPQPSAPKTAAPTAEPEPAAPAAEPEGDFDYDLVVLGSGPGGYVAAIRAGQLGLKVAVVEKDDRFGGTCLLRGCIPTKALLHTAELMDKLQKTSDFGVNVDKVSLDIAGAHAFKSKIVDKNAKGVQFLFKKNKVEGIHGFGRLVGPHEIEVSNGDDKRTISSRNILLATGSVPREIGVAPTDGKRIVNSDHVLEYEAVPGSVVVLGAGAVGMEFASIYRSFGCEEVTVVEMLPRVLPAEDEESSKEVARNYKKRGIKVFTDTKMTGVETTKNGVKVSIEAKGKEQVLEAEMLLVAVGRAPVTEGLGFEEQGVAMERGYVQVNEMMQTTVPHIYAIGDIAAGVPWLAHVASAMGIVAAEHMAGAETRPLNYGLVPQVTFCDPEVASVGMTETQAKEAGYDVECGKFPFSALGKAAILGKTEGFVKVVRETEYDQVLGIHIVGAHATDLIGEACAALQLETTAEELFRTIHAHPTMAESVAEAAHASHGAAIHF